MRKLTIKRSKWYRGNGSNISRLLLPKDYGEEAGEMCCLGFYCRSIGLSKSAIADVESPANLTVSLPKRAAWLLDTSLPLTDSEDCQDLMRVNDDDSIDDHEREAAIAAGFLKHGVEVVFVE